MQSHPQSLSESVLATGSSAPDPVVAPCPILAAVKARAKVLKKFRKNERKRYFFSWCACFHALGFSF